MKIETKDGDIILKEVFSGVGLETDSGETMGICMRDSGFEFNYGGKWYEAKEGGVSCSGCIKSCGMNYCDENGCTARTRNDADLVPCSSDISASKCE